MSVVKGAMWAASIHITAIDGGMIMIQDFPAFFSTIAKEDDVVCFKEFAEAVFIHNIGMYSHVSWPV